MTRSAPAPAVDRLARLGGSRTRPMSARTLAALAANPGCHRRALLDAAGVDKAAVAERLGEPAPFGQSRFALARGNRFEARVTADRCAALAELLRQDTAPAVPDLRGDTPDERLRRTREALAAAAATRTWTILVHPMLELDVAGVPARLEPDAVAVRADGTRTVVEIKSFPVVDGAADPAKVGAAARQAAAYVLALRALDGPAAGPVDDSVLLVCPKNFSNLPVAVPVDVRKQAAVMRRQLRRMDRIDALVDTLPEDLTFDLRIEGRGRERRPTRDPAELRAAVDTVPAAYAPECLSTCELAFHCRSAARGCGSVAQLGRGLRGDLGGLGTVSEALAAARDGAPAGADAATRDAAERLQAAARLRARALGEAS